MTLERDLRSVIIRRDSEGFALIGEFIIDSSAERESEMMRKLSLIHI